MFLLSPPPAAATRANGSGAGGGRGGEGAELFAGGYSAAADFFDSIDEGRAPQPRRGASVSEGGDNGAAGGGEGGGGEGGGGEGNGAAAGEGEGEGVLLCSTALNTARFVGRYLRLVRESGRDSPRFAEISRDRPRRPLAVPHFSASLSARLCLSLSLSLPLSLCTSVHVCAAALLWPPLGLEIWGRSGEIWGDLGRSGEIWGDTPRLGARG